jgi:HD-GYP domain-containing protein (c-di-GMP phosphodiesterase class II)
MSSRKRFHGQGGTPAKAASKAPVQLIDLILCLSDAMDFIDPAIVNHHRMVAYIAYRIGKELGLSPDQLKELILAGALHDVGAFSLKERRGLLEFEDRFPGKHSEAGYQLLKLFEPLAGIAAVVRHHHLPWGEGSGSRVRRLEVPLASHILHLADRVAVLVHQKREILGQAERICRKIRAGSGKTFIPEQVEAFLEVSSREFFWLDLVSPSLPVVLSECLREATIELDSEDMLGFAQLFSRIIDFKSPFTATHSSGVAASAEMLAGLTGFSEGERLLMRIAGHLHDLGKLAVPLEILDKPAPLVKKERNVIRHHTFYTHRILGTVPALRTVRQWAAFHHERLDGSGYPFHLKEEDLPLGSQIMAVADVFTALAENRPYRAGMRRRETQGILDAMAKDHALNGNIVSLLSINYDAVDAARRQAQRAANLKYRTLEKMAS